MIPFQSVAESIASPACLDSQDTDRGRLAPGLAGSGWRWRHSTWYTTHVPPKNERAVPPKLEAFSLSTNLFQVQSQYTGELRVETEQAIESLQEALREWHGPLSIPELLARSLQQYRILSTVPSSSTPSEEP